MSFRTLLARGRQIIILLAFLLSLVGGSPTSVKAATAITFTAEEFLSRPTDTTININVIPASAIELYYDYKVSGGTYSSTPTVSAAAGTPNNVVISGLSPDTQYYYHMHYHLPGETDWVTRSEHSFHTQRAPGDTFSFVVTSDTHSGLGGNFFSATRYNQTLSHILADDPDFWIDTGDTPKDDFLSGQTAYEDGYKLLRGNIKAVSGDVPFFQVLGNHEQEVGWSLDDETDPYDTQPIQAANARRLIFPNPKPDGFYSGNLDTSLTYINDDHLREDYYAWTWGDALFICLDPYWYTMKFPQENSTYPFGGEEDQPGEEATKGTRWDWTLGIDQYLWLKNTLATSTSTYKFVFIHNVTGGILPYGRGGTEIAGYFEWGGKSWDDTWGWDTYRKNVDSRWGDLPIHQLMDQYNVTIFFHGHDHFYAKQELDGIVYQEVPMPAAVDGFAGFRDEQTGTYASQYPDPARILFYDGATKYVDSGHLRVTVSPTGVTVDYVDMADGSITASYTIPASGQSSYDLTTAVAPAGSGTIDPPAGVHSYSAGSLVNVTATPASGYSFTNWSGACTGTGTCQVTMETAKSVTAHFSLDTAGTISYIGGIGSVVSKTSGTSLAINTTAVVAAGDDIIIAYATDPNSNIPPITVTDSAGNTYHEVGPAINSGQLRTYLFAAYDVNALPSGSNITITASASVTARAAVVSVFNGLADESPLDLTSTGTGNSVAPSSGATATTTDADELLIGAVGTEGPDGDTAGTWSNSFTAGPRLGTTGGTADTNITVSLGYRIVSATGAYTAAKSGITSRDWAALIATFKAEPSATVPRITITGTPLSAFSSLPGAYSAEQSYTVSGSNLTEGITITAPSGFEISKTSGSGFSSSLTLEQSGGSVAATTIYVRFHLASEGIASGNITHTSAGATTRNVAVSGTAAPLAPVAFNILLGRPTDKSVTANIIPDQNAEFFIEYGTSSGSYTAGQTSTFTATANTPIEIVIGGALSANQKYYYHIVYRQTGSTEWNEGAEYSFMTQRASNSTFTIDIVSDSHFDQYGGQTANEKDLYAQTLLNIAADHPDFYLDLGDTFAMDPLSPYGSGLGTGMTEANADAAYKVQRPYMGLITHSVPLFLAIGNHENEEGWNWDDTYTSGNKSLAIVGLKARKKYIPNPLPDDFYSGNTDTLPAQFLAAYPGLPAQELFHEDYYAWTWGDALFVVIDPYQYSMIWPNDEGTSYGGEGQDGEVSGDRWDWSLGIQQYLWLKQTLENSHAKYKFVMSHHVTGGETQYGRGGIDAAPYFEWGGKNADGTWGWDTQRPAAEGWDVPVHQLMLENGVTAYIHGHDHDFAWEELDGIAYVEVPKPDDAGYDWQPYSYGHNENLYTHAIAEIQNSGHIRMTISPTDVKFEYVRSYLTGDGTNGTIAFSRTIQASSDNHTVTFNANGGTGTLAPQVDDVPTALTLNAFTRAGYSFAGWNTATDGSGTGYTDGAIYSFAADITLYAQWTALPNHTVTFNANGGTGTMTPQVANVPTALNANTFTRMGYSLAGWNTASDGSGTAYADGALYSFSADVTLYAQWTVNSYTVTFNKNGGDTEASPATATTAYGGTVTLPMTNPTKAGHTFTGWNTAANGSGSTFTASTPVTASITVYAQYSQITHQVTFNLGDHGTRTGGGELVQIVNDGAAAVAPIFDVAIGWSFTGWDKAFTNVTSDLTVYAQYTQAAYDLTVDVSPTDSGTTNPAAGMHNYPAGSIVNIAPNPAAGYEFDYWSGACSGSGACQVTMDAHKSVTAHFTVITVPPFPSSFYGVIHIYDNPPVAGGTVEAFVPGITGAVASTTITSDAGTLIYIINIPGDNGIGPKEGGVEGDVVTFKIAGRIVATGTWHSGTNVHLDFHPPRALPGGSYTGDEDAAINFSGFANDWGTDVSTYQWDWDNNGTYDTTGQNPSHIWANPGIYTVGLKVTDAQGGEGTNTVNVTVNQVYLTHSIALVTGWNLVSFNVHPTDTNIATVLSSIDGNYDLVYAWDATGAHSGSGNWTRYDPTAPYGNTLGDLDETMGFWIHMTSPDTLEVTGTAPTTTNIELSIDAGGWNLVDYPSIANRSLPGALSDHGVGTDFSLVYAYHPTDVSDPWKLYDSDAPSWSNDLTELTPGWGYWVKVNVDHTWNVDYVGP